MNRRPNSTIVRNQDTQRRGAMLVLVALLITVFLGAVAFAVDVAYMQNVRTELRIATDAAARAAGEALSREQDIDAAYRAAKDLAALHQVVGKPLLLADDDIVPGNSTREGGGKWVFTPYGTPTNSIRIFGPRTRDSLSGSVPLFFAKIFGIDDFSTELTATAVRMDRDICIVVDRSTSMKLAMNSTALSMGIGDKRFCLPPDPVKSRWAALATAVDGFIAALGSTPQTEHIGLVSYASNYTSCGVVNTVADIDQELTPNDALVTSAMQSISDRAFNGMTNIAAGIDAGVLALTDPARVRPYSMKTMVLMTDGQRTDGRQPILAAEEAALEKIVIHTITFGHGADIPSMQEVAGATGGKHYHAPDGDALVDIFREIAYTIAVTLAE